MGNEKKTDSDNAARFKPDDVIAKQRNRQLAVVTVLIVLLAIPIVITANFKEEAGQLKELRLVGEVDGETRFAKDDVTRIEIWQGPDGDKLTLTRRGDAWILPGRHNAPAAKRDVDSLIQRVFDASRFNQPATTERADFVRYRLTDDEAAHLRLTGKDGELLHVMVGKSDGGSRDFVRLAGEGAPEGIFELTGLGGGLDTLYSALDLNNAGEPQPKRWLDLSGFQPLPYLAVPQRLSIIDTDVTLVFSRAPGSDPADDEWLMESPNKGNADGAGVRALIDALMNYSAEDIAGKSGLGTADAEKRVEIEYEQGGETKISRLHFGERRDGKVAVRLEGGKAGDFVYWSGDFILDRLFKPAGDFMKKERLDFLPQGVDVERIAITDGGVSTELVREQTESMTPAWKIEAPFSGDADYNRVSGLLRGLVALQGYRLGEDQDPEQHGVGPGVSERWVTISYPEATRPDDRDNDGEEDPPELEDQPEDGSDEPAEDPEEPAADTEPPTPLKTSHLYVGQTDNDEVTVMIVTGEKRVLYRIAASALAPVFNEPGHYVKLSEIKLLAPGQNIEEIRVTNAEETLHLIREEVVEGGGKRWQMKTPEEEQAAQNPVNDLVAKLRALRALPRPDGLDRNALGLADDASQVIDLRVNDGEESLAITIRFGAKVHGLTAMSVTRAADDEKFFLAHPNDVSPLMVSPRDYRNIEAFDVKVRHILLSWKGKSEGLAPKDPNRTEQQARELAQEILERARAGENFVELQREYNEDGDPTAVYPVDQNTQFVRPFKRLASELEVNEIGIVESQFGMHVIKRVE